MGIFVAVGIILVMMCLLALSLAMVVDYFKFKSKFLELDAKLDAQPPYSSLRSESWQDMFSEQSQKTQRIKRDLKELF